MDSERELYELRERLNNADELACLRTDQLVSALYLNYELVEALRSVRSHLGLKELRLVERAEKTVFESPAK